MVMSKTAHQSQLEKMYLNVEVYDWGSHRIELKEQKVQMISEKE